MPRKAKYFLFISYTALGMAIFLLSDGCKKEYSEEDFVNTLKGEWTVQSFNTGYYMLSINQDSLYYSTQLSSGAFSLDDPSICVLDCIENMGTWTITEKNDTLRLETRDLCGGIKNYYIEFSIIAHEEETHGILGMPENVRADVNIISKDKVIILSDFYLTIGDDGYAIEFSMNESEMSGEYTLWR